MKNLYLLIGLLFTGTFSFSQTIIPISDEGLINDLSCAEEIILTDSDAIDGDYGPNENYTLTVCVEAGSESVLEIIISPILNGDIWDVDGGSELIVFDGADDTAPILGSYNSVNDPNGITVTGTGGCLTFTFISGADSSAAGFEAHVSCIQPLQDFIVNVSTIPDFEEGEEDPVIFICPGDSIIAQAITQYPLSDASGVGNYTQHDSTSYFRWQMGDGTTYNGYGLTEISHTYEAEYGYQITLLVTDVNGKVENTVFYVFMSTRPDFSNFALNDTLCIGEQTNIIGGITAQDSVGFDEVPGAILGGGILGEQAYLPDGNDEIYQTTITIDDFGPDQTITNITDIISICVNMEHTYIGDLEMWLTCPDGTTITLFNANTAGEIPGGFGGGGTFLGDANDGTDGVPGIGFDYCFSTDPEFGSFEDEYLDNIVEVNSFPPGGTAVAAGSYEPDESFENFIGCPINGDWTLNVKDNLFSDDGFIFSWSILFDPQINPNTVYYTPEIVNAGWSPNPDIIAYGDTLITVIPSSEGNNAFTFFVEDNFGCFHDTTLFVYVRPGIEAADAISCTFDHTLVASNIPNNDDEAGNGGWTNLSLPDGATIDYDVLGGGVTTITVSDYGIYEFEVRSEDCPGPEYIDTAAVDFRPTPDIDLPESAVLCDNDSLLLYVGDYDDNEDYNEIWTLDGSSIAQGVSSIYADETGLYFATVSGYCGSDTASTSLQFVNVSATVPQNPFCGLETFPIQGSVDPVGTTTWITSHPNISFSNPSSLSTTAISTSYGEYEIGIVDDRCPDEPFTFNVNFLEQPEVYLAPQNPVFCPDDELIVSAFTTGYFTGDYMWNVSMSSTDPEDMPVYSMNQNDTLIVPENQFTPLVTYTLSAQVLGYPCLPASDSIVFQMKACEYNIPNVFSPNGDGQNEVFRIEFLEFYPGSSLTVYNRWGNEVYAEANYDQANNWDGGDLPDGVYFFELLMPFIGKLETGNVTIIRGSGAN